MDGAPGSTRRRRSTPRQRWRARAASITVLALLCAGWLAFRGYQAASGLEQARAALSGLGSLDDLDRAGPALEQAADGSGRARGASRDPLWSLAARLPWLGGPFRSVSDVAEASDGLLRDTLPVLMQAGTELRDVRAVAPGSLPLERIAALDGPLTQAENGLARAARLVGPTIRGPRIARIDNARAELAQRVRELQGPVSTAAAAAAIAPGMLGDAGRRRYFVAFENRAELRPGGGLLGGFAELVVEGGSFRVVRFGNNSDLPPLARTPLAVSPTFLAAYGNRGAGRSWINTNLSPDFAEGAAAWAAMYAEAIGAPVDGVISLDAVALGELAVLDGRPLTAPGLPAVAGEDVADFLERQQYSLGLSTDVREDRVSELGRVALTALTGSQLPGTEALAVLGRLAGGHHLRLFSVRPQEQEVLRRFPVSGALSQGEPYAGVFLSNAAGSKLDAYLETRVEYAQSPCTAEGQDGLVTVRLRNDAPPSGLPEYVTLRSDRPEPLPPVGQNRIAVTVLGSRGAVLLEGRLDQQVAVVTDDPQLGVPPGAVGLDSETVDGRPGWRVVLELPRGVERVLTLRLQEPPLEGEGVLSLPNTVRPASGSLQRCGSPTVRVVGP